MAGELVPVTKSIRWGLTTRTSFRPSSGGPESSIMAWAGQCPLGRRRGILSPPGVLGLRHAPLVCLHGHVASLCIPSSYEDTSHWTLGPRRARMTSF